MQWHRRCGPRHHRPGRITKRRANTGELGPEHQVIVPREKRPRPDQDDHPAEPQQKSRQPPHRQRFAQYEKGQRQDKQRHNRHGDPGETRWHPQLPPPQKGKGNGIGKQGKAKAMQPDAPVRRCGTTGQAMARGKSNRSQQHRANGNPGRCNGEGAETLKRHRNAQKRCPPDKAKGRQQQPVAQSRTIAHVNMPCGPERKTASTVFSPA